MLDATPLLRIYAKRRLRRLARLVPAEAQRRTLLRLLASARDTRFGREHGFGTIRDVAGFRAAVPLRRYEDFWRAYFQPSFPRLTGIAWPGTIPFFAVTSGTTTGVTKYIPCSRQMIDAYLRAGLDLLAFHVTNRPASRMLGGRGLMLGGSTALARLAPGVRAGDLSGIVAREFPLWARLRAFPPPEIERIGDWEEKIARLAPLALETDIRAIGGTPAWLLAFLHRLGQISGKGSALRHHFPHLELVVHGGVNFAPYRTAFAELMAGTHAETREIYAASEGFIAIADRGSGEGLRLVLDRGLFYEFVPADEIESANPTRHWIAEAEVGVNYALALSTCAGLWAYLVGDTVRLVERNPPRVLVTGRTSYTLSAIGEHLIGEEIEGAVAEAAESIGAKVNDFVAGPLYPARAGEHARHLYIVEFAEGVPEERRLARFAATLDSALAATNADYRALRTAKLVLGAPLVHAVAPGRFAEWMKARGQLGGQHKVPRVMTDTEALTALRAFMEHRARPSGCG